MSSPHLPVRAAPEPHFTGAAAQRIESTVDDYRRELEARAALVARAHTAPDEFVEVTAEHVRGAARALAVSAGTKGPSGWVIAGQVVEYLCAIGVGVASGKLDSAAGIVAFAAFAAIGVLLLTARVSRRNTNDA